MTAADGIAAGYVRPWVVAAGRPATLHAHLPRRAVVDIVRIACANAERHDDGSPWGPVERILPVTGAGLGELGPVRQSLLPGTQVRVRCDSLPEWHDLALVVALQRRPRARVRAPLTPSFRSLRSLRSPSRRPARARASSR